MSYEILGNWWKYFAKIIIPATFATIRILTATIFFGFTLGFILAILLIIYGPDGLKPKPKLYKVLDFFISTIRSFPMLILIIAIAPLTRFVVGTIIGEKAAIFPLTISATAFIARLLENAFRSVDEQLIEAAKSMGASNIQIVFKVIVRESIPSIISILTMSIISYLASTTIAGAVGGGGLGAVALNYGHQSFNNFVLYTSVIILLIIVQIIQGIGNWLYKRIL